MLSPCRACTQHQQRQQQQALRHKSPPAYPGLAAGGRGPPPPRSSCLYHEINAAKATMMAKPKKLTTTCGKTRLENPVKTKWAAKGRKTPQNNIVSAS